MKDAGMSQYQDLADKTERALNRAENLLAELEAMTCKAAADGDTLAEQANPFLAIAKGHVAIAKGEATKAGNLIPDLTVAFGGDGK